MQLQNSSCAYIFVLAKMFMRAHALFMDNKLAQPKYLTMKTELRAAVASGDEEWATECRQRISAFLRDRAATLAFYDEVSPAASRVAEHAKLMNEFLLTTRK